MRGSCGPFSSVLCCCISPTKKAAYSTGTVKHQPLENVKPGSASMPESSLSSVFVTSCPTRQAVTDDFAFSGWSTVSSVRHLPCPLVTRVQVCVVLGWGKFKCFRPKTRQWLIPGAEPEASGQGPSTPLCLKLQLQKQASGRPHPDPCQCVCGPLQASWSLLSGSLRVRGGDTNSTSHPAGPRRLLRTHCGPRSHARPGQQGGSRTTGPGRSGSHPTRGRTPGGPRLHPHGLTPAAGHTRAG